MRPWVRAVPAWFLLLVPPSFAADCPLVLFGAAHTGGPSAPSSLYRIDPISGAAAPVGPIGFNAVGGMDFDPATGILYGTGNRPGDGVTVLLVIDPNTGRGREVGPLLNTLRGPFDLSFRSGDGVLFALAFSRINPCSSLFTIDLADGAATEIDDTTTCAAGDALGFSSDDTLYQANNQGGGTLFTVDTALGTSTVLSALAYFGFPGLNDPRPNAMDFDLAAGYAWISINDGSRGAGPNYLGTLNPANGRIDHVGLSVNGLDALAFGPAWFGPSLRPSANLVDFVWDFPLDFLWVRGSFTRQADIGSYGFDRSGASTGSLFHDPDFPVPGTGFWYLLRPDCTTGSWTSGGPGECATPGTCLPGGRDGNLP